MSLLYSVNVDGPQPVGDLLWNHSGTVQKVLEQSRSHRHGQDPVVITIINNIIIIIIVDIIILLFLQRHGKV